MIPFLMLAFKMVVLFSGARGRKHIEESICDRIWGDLVRKSNHAVGFGRLRACYRWCAGFQSCEGILLKQESLNNQKT